MPARAELDALAQSIDHVRTLTERALRRLLASLPDEASEADVRRLLAEDVPALVLRHGDMTATLGADFYDEARAEVLGLPRWSARIAPDWTRVQVSRELQPVLRALGDAGQISRDELMSSLRNPVDKLVTGQARRTVAYSVSRDPARPRWAKVPHGRTCAWCLMIASRGPVFRTERSANSTFHGHCDCQAVPMWRGSPYPEDYDPDALRDQYLAARAELTRPTPKQILAEMRRQGDLA